MGDSFSMEAYASQFVNGNKFDNSKEKLGWEPTVALDDGLEKTIAYFRGI